MIVDILVFCLALFVLIVPLLALKTLIDIDK